MEIQKYNLNEPKSLINMAQTLKKHIVNNKLYVPIKGKNYVQVEGWQFAGGLLGLVPIITEIKDLSTEKEIKWLAVAKIKSIEGNTVAKGYAICSNKESKKASFDEYAILSMAQTRAIGKAYRNVLAWIIKLAGYEPTPAEEMTEKENPIDQIIRDLKAKDDKEALEKLMKKEGLSQEYIDAV